MIVLDMPVLTVQDGKARVTSRVTEGNSVKDLWFEVEAEFAKLLPTKTLDAFVLVCLLRAVNKKTDIYVRGAMSSKLHYNINTLLGGVLKQFFKSDHTVTITAQQLVVEEKRAEGVLSGFSGGIDSFCNYHDHSDNRATADFRITHFVYNNVGSHGQKGEAQDFETFNKHSANIRAFAAAEGKPLITVNSNLDDLVGMSFEKTHTLRNAAVALLLQDVASTFLYPSGYHVADTSPKPSHDIAFLDPIILPLLGTERMDCIGSGAQYTRAQKAAIVTSVPSSWQRLDICIDPLEAPPGKINCSACRKCVRTQLTFDALGKLELYNDVFDIKRYLMCKNLFLVDALRSHNTLQKDVRAMIAEMGQTIPWRVRAVAALTPLFIAKRIGTRLVPHVVRKPWLAKLCDLAFGKGAMFPPPRKAGTVPVERAICALSPDLVA